MSKGVHCDINEVSVVLRCDNGSIGRLELVSHIELHKNLLQQMDSDHIVSFASTN